MRLRASRRKHTSATARWRFALGDDPRGGWLEVGVACEGRGEFGSFGHEGRGSVGPACVRGASVGGGRSVAENFAGGRNQQLSALGSGGSRVGPSGSAIDHERTTGEMVELRRSRSAWQRRLYRSFAGLLTPPPTRSGSAGSRQFSPGTGCAASDSARRARRVGDTSSLISQSGPDRLRARSRRRRRASATVDPRDVAAPMASRIPRPTDLVTCAHRARPSSRCCCRGESLACQARPVAS